MKRILRFSLILILNYCMLYSLSGQVTGKLPRSTPEAEGVSSKDIIDFLNAIDTGKIEIHSFIFMRHGKIIAEGWWNPYGPDLKHLMYSASKTFAATGVGLAIAENKLSLSDKVVSFFPASLPDTLSEFMKMMTVKDLLTMSVGQDAEPRRGQNDDWIRSFLEKAPVYKPGTTFKYNNTASFILSAIVQQVTNQSLFDYLLPRIFQPLGIRGIDWDLNPQGINLGLMGLRLRTEDMAKFGQLLLQNGEWNGRQLIPKEWVKEATTFKIKSQGGTDKIPPEINDWYQGYCYQMWRGKNNSVRLDGMAGQFVILVPDKDAIVVLTANASDTQKEMDLVWTYLLSAIKGSKPLPADPEINTELQRKLASLSVRPAPMKSVVSTFTSRISGKSVEFQSNNYGIQALGFKFNNDICELAIKRDNITYYIKAGQDIWKYSGTNLSSLFSGPRTNVSKSIDANYGIIQPTIKLAASYSWTDKNTLELTARFVEESLGSEGFICRFTEEGGAINVILERKTGRGIRMGPGVQTTPIVLNGKVIE
ncbi:MAG: beta-lactamase family protein [Bacteroidales bacterium]|nr:beta-lactamase family protein [Bacteroidales bacterium]